MKILINALDQGCVITTKIDNNEIKIACSDKKENLINKTNKIIEEYLKVNSLYWEKHSEIEINIEVKKTK